MSAPAGAPRRLLTGERRRLAGRNRLVRRHRRGGRLAKVGALAIAFVVLAVGWASAAVPPNPLPWQRTYVANVDLTAEQRQLELFAACNDDIERGVKDNGAAGKPKYAVIGDSVQAQTRAPALADTAYVRWLYATHCGEKFSTVLSSGRVADALATAPDVLVLGFGSNNFSENWQISPSLFGPAIASFTQIMDQSNGVPCRVLINVPERAPSYLDAATQAQWISLIRQLNQVYANTEATRPGVHVADWRLLTALFPGLVYDDEHLTRAGINLRINLALATARQCFAPDTPANVNALAGNGTATVWWDPLPGEEKVTGYQVEVSDGRTLTTPTPTLNVGGLANGTPVQFRVRAVNAKGTSTPSAWTTAVTPSPAGARFHALPPTRVLDTRDGTGGPASAIGPGESRTLDIGAQLPALASGASAVVLNVTATGQSAESFVTVWPGGQTRPLASNLNPRPGGGDTPAMVTTRVGPGGTVQLYNNSGSTHLVADVVGWYDQPGSGSGSLYVPLSPTRVLDSRDGTGGKATPFGAAESKTLRLDALPADATAAVVNVTSVNTTNSGFLTLSPTGQTRPLASNLNPTAGRVRANLTTVAVGTDRSIDVFNNTASTDVVMDLVGYYTAAGATTGGAEYFPITPERAFDSRDGTGGLTGPVGNGTDTVLSFAGKGSVPAPASVSAVDANVTVVGPTAAGHTTVWPSGVRPLTSVLNYQAGEVVPNRDTVTLDTGAARIWSVAPQIQYIVDVSGWFGPPILDAQTLARRVAAGQRLP